MKLKNLITLSILSCFIFAFAGFKSERNVQTQREEASPSLLSFVDMNTYTLVLSDPTTCTKAKVDLKGLKGWPGPAPEHTLLLPDGKKVLVTYMASATEPVGIAVIKINSINWMAGTADVQVVKNLETDKAGTRSTFPPVTQTSPDQEHSPYLRSPTPRRASKCHMAPGSLVARTSSSVGGMASTREIEDKWLTWNIERPPTGR